jgi:hypothetical protein
VQLDGAHERGVEAQRGIVDAGQRKRRALDRHLAPAPHAHDGAARVAAHGEDDLPRVDRERLGGAQRAQPARDTARARERGRGRDAVGPAQRLREVVARAQRHHGRGHVAHARGAQRGQHPAHGPVAAGHDDAHGHRLQATRGRSSARPVRPARRGLLHRLRTGRHGAHGRAVEGSGRLGLQRDKPAQVLHAGGDAVGREREGGAARGAQRARQGARHGVAPAAAPRREDHDVLAGVQQAAD